MANPANMFVTPDRPFGLTDAKVLSIALHAVLSTSVVRKLTAGGHMKDTDAIVRAYYGLAEHMIELFPSGTDALTEVLEAAERLDLELIPQYVQPEVIH